MKISGMIGFRIRSKFMRGIDKSKTNRERSSFYRKPSTSIKPIMIESRMKTILRTSIIMMLSR